MNKITFHLGSSTFAADKDLLSKPLGVFQSHGALKSATSYNVKSNVQRHIFRIFLSACKKNILPQVTPENRDQMTQLCEEFDFEALRLFLNRAEPKIPSLILNTHSSKNKNTSKNSNLHATIKADQFSPRTHLKKTNNTDDDDDTSQKKLGVANSSPIKLPNDKSDKQASLDRHSTQPNLPNGIVLPFTTIETSTTTKYLNGKKIILKRTIKKTIRKVPIDVLNSLLETKEETVVTNENKDGGPRSPITKKITKRSYRKIDNEEYLNNLIKEKENESKKEDSNQKKKVTSHKKDTKTKKETPHKETSKNHESSSKKEENESSKEEKEHPHITERGGISIEKADKAAHSDHHNSSSSKNAETPIHKPEHESDKITKSDKTEKDDDLHKENEERLQREKEERQQREEQERLQREEEERIQREKEEEERLQREKEEEERKQREKEEEERLQREKEEEERKQREKEEEERLQREKEEEERQQREEEERLQREKEEEERKQREKEEEERLQREEEERLQREKEEEERKQREEEERLQREKEEEERKQREKEEEERLQREKEEQERKQREEEERRVQSAQAANEAEAGARIQTETITKREIHIEESQQLLREEKVNDQTVARTSIQQSTTVHHTETSTVKSETLMSDILSLSMNPIKKMALNLEKALFGVPGGSPEEDQASAQQDANANAQGSSQDNIANEDVSFKVRVARLDYFLFGTKPAEGISYLSLQNNNNNNNNANGEAENKAEEAPKPFYTKRAPRHTKRRLPSRLLQDD